MVVRASQLNPPDLSWSTIARDLAMGLQDLRIRAVFYTKRFMPTLSLPSTAGFCRTQPLKALAYCVLAALSVAVIVRASSRSNAEARRFGERFDAGGGSGEKIDEVRIEMGRRREDPQLYRAAWVPLPPFKSDCTLRRRRKMRDKLVVLSRRLGVPEQDEQGGLGPLDHLAAHAHPHVRAAAHGPHQRVVEERDHLRAALALCEAQFGKLQEVGKDRRVVSTDATFSPYFAEMHEQGA